MPARFSGIDFRRSLLILFVCLAFVPAACARLWTTVNNEHFEADFLRAEGANGIFLVKGKEYPYPLNRLSVPDRLFVGRATNGSGEVSSASGAGSEPAPADSAGEASSAPAGKASSKIDLAGQPLKPGGSVQLEIPILDPAGLREVQHAYGKASHSARMLLAVPDDFAPATKSYPLLIVSATTDGGASSIATCYQYLDDALARGFVVMAVDGEFGKPTAGDPPSYRWALVAAGRAALEKEWRGAKEWPVATAGVSGGGGYASYNALKLLQERANFIGLLLAVSPHNPTKFSRKISGVPTTLLHNIPIFMSAGDKDERATPEVIESSHRELVHDGFKNVRFEHFDGGHQLYKPHLQAALDWFLQEKSKSDPD